MGSTYTERLEDTQRDLASYFDKSAAVVRSNFGWFEKKVARPTIAYSAASFDAHPFITAFLAIFTFLSCLPIISFFGFSLFVIASVTFMVFALGFVTVALAEGVLVTILLITLTFLLIFSLILTPLVLSGYLAFRLIVRVRSEGQVGASRWATETRRHFVTHRKAKTRETIEGSEMSTGSGSVVFIDAKEEDLRLDESEKVEDD